MSKEEKFTLEAVEYAWDYCNLSPEYFEQFILPAMREYMSREVSWTKAQIEEALEKAGLDSEKAWKKLALGVENE